MGLEIAGFERAQQEAVGFKPEGHARRIIESDRLTPDALPGKPSIVGPASGEIGVARKVDDDLAGTALKDRAFVD